MYADDTTLYSQFDNAEIANHDIEFKINNELSNINDWLKINKLALNVKKSKYMISTKAHTEPKKLELKIDNINIEYVNFFNFLGFTIDSHLTWENHTINMSNKCLRIIGTLNRIKYSVPLNIRFMLHNALILPHLNYCVTAWGYQCNRIIKLQKKTIRTVMISSYNAHTESFFKNLKLLKIQDILTLQTLKIYIINFEIINSHITYKIGHYSKILTFTITTRAEQMHYTKTDVFMYLHKSRLN